VSGEVIAASGAGPSPSGLGPLDGPGAVDGLMLDIGGDTGALVILVDAPLDGSEIEVTGAGGHTHARVHRRRSADGHDVWAAVFVALERGPYEVELPGDRRTETIEVVGGRVTTSDRRGSIGDGPTERR
jgi:hypothetical protein